MTKNKPNPKVDAFLRTLGRWQQEMTQLRTIVQTCGLTEELKWGCPCYTLDGSNVVLLHTFKDYCAILFCKGVLLQDPQGILVQQTANVQAARQIRFTRLREIVQQESTIKAYLAEAIAAEKSGLKVAYKPTAEFKTPAEFQARLDKTPVLKGAFAALTPGRQRGYLLYFSSAKQSSTRESRIEKSLPKILAGQGLADE